MLAGPVHAHARVTDPQGSFVNDPQWSFVNDPQGSIIIARPSNDA